MGTTRVTCSDFLVLASVIDTSLQAKGIAISHRPLEAANEISRRLGVHSPFAIKDKPSNPDSYAPGELGRAIYEWYLERYGDKARYDMDLGRAAFWLRGDSWFMRIPIVFDWANVDFLGFVHSLTPYLRHDLTVSETDEIKKVFYLATEAFTYMMMKKAVAYVTASLGDHRSAIDCLSYPDPRPDHSKWASLQATEKVIKSFTASKQRKPGFSHDLIKIAEEAEALGLNPVDRNLIAQIQCTPNARYGEEAITTQEAICAHLSALQVSALVAVQL